MAQDLMNNGMALKHILVRWNQKTKLDDITFHPPPFYLHNRNVSEVNIFL
jgi:hypothetical protein